MTKDLTDITAEQAVRLVSESLYPPPSGANGHAHAFRVNGSLNGNRPSAEKSGENPFVRLARVFLSVAEPLVAARDSLVDLDRLFGELDALWDRFVRYHIIEPYGRLLDGVRSSTGGDNSIHPLLLHYPLFAQRKIANELRHINPRVFRFLLCVRPAALYSHERLWDVLDAPSPGRQDYFGELAFAVEELLEGCSGTAICPQFCRFLQAIKSPYRSFYEHHEYFELVPEGDGHRPVSIMVLSLAEAISRHGLRDEQCHGFMIGDDKYAPPPFTAEALLCLSLNWRSKSSEFFFRLLPAEVLRKLEEVRPDIAVKIIQSVQESLFASYDGLLATEEVLDAMRRNWRVPLEFPEMEPTRLRIAELREVMAAEAARGGEADGAEARIRLLSELERELEQTYEDSVLDLKRIEAARERAERRLMVEPWNSAKLKTELAEATVEFDRTALWQYECAEHLSAVRTRLANQAGRASSSYGPWRAIAATWRHYPELHRRFRLRERLLAEGARILTPVSTEIAQVFCSVDIDDPLFSGAFSLPSQYSPAVQEAAHLLSERPYDEVKRIWHYEEAVVDVAEISRLLRAGTPVAKLRKRFRDHVVDAVLMRHLVTEENGSYQQLQAKFPHLRGLIGAIEKRDKLEIALQQVAAALSESFHRLKKAAAADLSEPGDFQLQGLLYELDVLELAWEWVMGSVRSPYQFWKSRAEGVDERAAIEAKKLAFVPWFEREISRVLFGADRELFYLLVLGRPAAVFGLEAICDLNFDSLTARRLYVKTLAQLVAARIEKVPDPLLLEELAVLLNGLPSPFYCYSDFERYDLDRICTYLLIITDSQQRMIDSKARRIAVDFWIAQQEKIFFGSEDRCGTLISLIIQALELSNPLLSRRISEQIAGHAVKTARKYRDMLLPDRDYTGAQIEALAGKELAALSDYIDQLDLLRDFLAIDRQVAEVGMSMKQSGRLSKRSDASSPVDENRESSLGGYP